jgi:hypothetical protein
LKGRPTRPSIAFAIIHLQDQGGLLGDQSPTWLRWGYYLVEVSSLLAALLVARKKTAGWVLGLGASAFPLIGYILSRTVGIPGDSGDIANWGYTLGQVSLGVEASFVVIASVCLTGSFWPGAPTQSIWSNFENQSASTARRLLT